MIDDIYLVSKLHCMIVLLHFAMCRSSMCGVHALYAQTAIVLLHFAVRYFSMCDVQALYAQAAIKLQSQQPSQGRCTAPGY
jgi:hypothetical protein